MRPRDAATLIIVRDQREVLLGVRSAGHVFMPHVYVFPGGRVDAGDARVPSPVSLRPDVLKRLSRNTTEPRARALAMTAVRETFEETGLILGRSAPAAISTGSVSWKPFFDTGFAPALDRMDYVARAITPPGRVRRFDARFFLADARHMHGELQGNGELEDLHWAAIGETGQLKLSQITRLILDLLHDRLTGKVVSSDSIPLLRYRNGRDSIEHE